MKAEDTEEKNEDWQKKAEEYLNNWKRTAADFINYKKEEIERSGALARYSKEDMFLNLLPILDSIYLLEKHVKVEGINLIQKQIREFIKREGIEEIKTEGEKFDPETMEAIEQVDGPEQETVVEELQKGYLMNGRVLRPAKVKVAK